MTECPECDGIGYVVYDVFRAQSFSRDVGDFEEETLTCENCNGSGEVEPMEDE